MLEVIVKHRFFFLDFWTFFLTPKKQNICHVDGFYSFIKNWIDYWIRLEGADFLYEFWKIKRWVLFYFFILNWWWNSIKIRRHYHGRISILTPSLGNVIFFVEKKRKFSYKLKIEKHVLFLFSLFTARDVITLE